MRKLFTLVALLFAARLLTAQGYTLPLPSQMIASTYCLTVDSTVLTVINAEVLGTDSSDEILVHEAVHRQTMRDSLRITGHCPGPVGDRAANMAREIIAYCVSDSVRELRTHDPAEASKVTVARLVDQYWGEIDPETIVDAWHRGCPRYARKA